MSNSDFEQSKSGASDASADVDPNLTSGTDFDPAAGFDSQGKAKSAPEDGQADLASDQQQLREAAASATASTASSGAATGSGADYGSGSSAAGASDYSQKAVADYIRGALVTAQPSQSLYEVAALMRDEDVGTVVIAEGDSISGIVTDRDIVVRALADSRDAETAVAEIASTEVETIESSASVVEAKALMEEQAIRRLVVVDGGQPVGVISLGDLTHSAIDTDEVYETLTSAPADK